MLPKSHIIIGFVLTLIIFLIFPSLTIFGAIIIFLSSFLIDFDHYLYFVINKKSFNLKKAYVWFVQKSAAFKKLNKEEQEKYKRGIIIFHGVECWVLLILLIIFFNKFFLFVLIGIAIHMVLDFIDLYQNKQPLYVKTSQIYTHIKNKKAVEFK